MHYNLSVNHKKYFILLFAGFLLLWLPSIWSFFKELTLLVQVAFLLLPLLVFVQQKGNYSYRAFFLVVPFIFLYLIFPFKVLLVFIWWYSIYGLIELNKGKLNNMAFLLPLFYSPVVRHTMSMFGIKLRIWLTEVAGWIINLMNGSVSINQSEISVSNKTFFVDTACIGLKMLSTSFILLFVIIAFNERIKKIKFSTTQLFFLLFINFFFLLGSNLLRIVLLIHFRIGPDLPMHDVIGILTLVVINSIPLIYIGNKIKGEAVLVKEKKGRFQWGSIGLLFILFIQFKQGTPESKLNLTLLNDDFVHNGRLVNDGVLEYRPTPTSNVYIKEQNFMKLSNHNPLVCWRFSGYKITNEKQLKVGDQLMNSAILLKNNEILYSSWIYVSKENMTIDEVGWRKEELFGVADYVLVNVVSYSEDELSQVSLNVLSEGIFN